MAFCNTLDRGGGIPRRFVVALGAREEMASG